MSRRSVAVYFVLTVAVWGLFALDRGLWQDDVAILSVVESHDDGSVAGLLAPILAPTRRLLGLPYALALSTGRPVPCLQLLYGATWLGLGFVAHALARLLWPGRLEAAYLVGALSLSATSDFLTNSLVSLGYDVSALGFFAALTLLLRWRRRGGVGGLIGSMALLGASLWTMEAALPSALLAPFLLWVAGGRRIERGLVVATLAWCAVLAPFLWSFVPFVHDPHSYAATALQAMTAAERLQRTAVLFLGNFEPWRWRFDRPVWFQRPEHVIPAGVEAVVVALAAAVFLWGARGVRRPGSGAGGPAGEPRGAVMVCVLMALVSNAAFAGLQGSGIFYRTQVFSRIWASLALGVAGAGLIARLGQERRGLRAVGLLLPTLFVALGVAGGLERQDYFLATWRQHRRQLASIVDAAPALRPEALVLLRTPPVAAYLATEAAYLARSWFAVLYEDPSLSRRVHLWSPERGTGCRAEERAFRCWDEGEAECFAAGSCEGSTLPYARLVLMTYDPDAGRFRLETSLPPEVLGEGRHAEGYAPETLIAPGPARPSARRLLFGRPALARYLPGYCSDPACDPLSAPEPR